MNSEFSFLTSCLTKAEEPSLPYHLLIAWGRMIRSIPFLRVLVLCEMQSVLSRIWTRFAVSISYDDNHYTTDTFSYIWLYICMCVWMYVYFWLALCVCQCIRMNLQLRHCVQIIYHCCIVICRYIYIYM